MLFIYVFDLATELIFFQVLLMVGGAFDPKETKDLLFWFCDSCLL